MLTIWCLWRRICCEQARRDELQQRRAVVDADIADLEEKVRSESKVAKAVHAAGFDASHASTARATQAVACT